MGQLDTPEEGGMCRGKNVRRNGYFRLAEKGNNFTSNTSAKAAGKKVIKTT